MLEREADPRALHKLAAACGAYRHPALRRALKGLWDARGGRLEGLFYAQAAVLASLGAQDSGLEEDRAVILKVGVMWRVLFVWFGWVHAEGWGMEGEDSPVVYFQTSTPQHPPKNRNSTPMTPPTPPPPRAPPTRTTSGPTSCAAGPWRAWP